MVETLLTPSSIKLYGRLVKSLQFKNDTFAFGGDYFLQRQLAAIGTITLTAVTNATPMVTVDSNSGLRVGQVVSGDGAIIPAAVTIAAVPSAAPHASSRTTFDLSAPALVASPGTVIIVNTGPANFARIYAFSFEGAIYSLPRPSMFLVHGTGFTIDADNWKGGRSSLEQSGVIAREWEFSGDDNLSYWEYEKGDFSVRLDMEAGPFEQILLMAALRAGADMADRATGIRSGASLAGASLAGASLSGASLSGASLSGASLSGASLRNGR